MHDQEVSIILVDPGHHEQQFAFEEAQLCIVGRARDCDISAWECDENLLVSRYHCLLQIDPPTVRVHDLGSTNGTFVNGVRIPRGQRKRIQRAGIPLFDGDEVAIGPVVLRVRVPAPEQSETQSTFALEFDGTPMRLPVGDSAERTVELRKSTCR